MTASYIPIVLNAAILPDGEAAQILSIVNNASSPSPVLLAEDVVAQPYRKGRMRVMFLLNYTVTDDVNDALITIRMRSPFPGDNGSQSNRPLVSIQPASPGSVFVSLDDTTILTPAFWAGPTGGLPGAEPPTVAADFSPTFNGKAIPNWGVSIGNSAVEGESSMGVYVTIDFGYSSAN